MNKCILQILLLISLPVGSELHGRQTGPSVTVERVVLFSDRNLYVAGEPVLFSAFLFPGEELADTLQSRVLYCELITPGGIKIAGNKFMIEDSHASGSINIPGDLITGTYFLRAYTRHMRNYGPYSYDYIALKVINPYREEVQAAEQSHGMTENNSDAGEIYNSGSPFRISTDRSWYARRDTVHISIVANPLFNTSLKGLSLAVVPEASVYAGVVNLPGNDHLKTDQYHVAESHSITITGRLTDNVTGRALPYKRVSLSILGKGKDFMAMQTDSAGRFFFPLPAYTGYRDLFLCTEKAAGPEIKILVDNDFCTSPVLLPSGKFELSAQESEAAYRMAVNRQLGSYFHPDTVAQDISEPGDGRAFYGIPDDILYIDDYIELPTLEEYFNGLPTLVRVRKSKGEKYFKVLGTQASLNNFEPLVLVDLVAVDDPSRILAVSPLNISRIEVVNQLYMKGDETFGGIISIISRHGDFAGIDLPESGIFINYGFLAGNANTFSSASPKVNYPDTRNTLYWDPDLSLNQNRSAGVSLTVSDITERYLIVLKGISDEGERVVQTFPLEIRKK